MFTYGSKSYFGHFSQGGYQIISNSYNALLWKLKNFGISFISTSNFSLSALSYYAICELIETAVCCPACRDCLAFSYFAIGQLVTWNLRFVNDR